LIKKGWCAAHYAACEDKTNVLVYLHKLGAILDARDRDSKAPIDIALQSHKVDSITFLRLCKLTKDTHSSNDQEAAFANAIHHIFNSK